MHKITLLIVFVLLSAITKAQKSVLFKFKYLPLHTYEIATREVMAAEIAMQDLTVSPDKDTDTTTKTIKFMVNTEEGTTIKTDAIAAGSFPLTILGNRFSSKTTLNGTEAPGPETNPLQGKTVKGKIDADGKLLLDTTTATSEVKSVAAALTGRMPQKLKLPDKPMMVGDTFTQEGTLSNMNLPDFGIDMDYPTKVIYKLTAVKDNLAYFDMTSEFKMNINKEVQGKTVNINGKGSGTGKAEFFIDKGYPKSTVNSVDYVLEMTGPNTRVGVKWNLSTDAKYVVSRN